MEIKHNKNVFNLHRLILLFAIFFCIISILYLILTPPASGYEISLYLAFHPLFWFFFITSMVLAAVSIILFVFNPMKKIYFFLSIIIIIIIFSIFYFLPLVRGYAFFNGSAILHRISLARTIRQIGHVHPEDFYPAPHLILTQLKIMGIPYFEGVLGTQLLMNLIYISFIYYYLRKTEFKTKYYYPIVFCSLPFLYLRFHVIFTPAVMSFLIIPLFLYLLKKDEKNQNDNRVKVLITLIAIFIVFFHPLSTLFLILIVIVMHFSQKIHPYLNQDYTETYNYSYTILILFLTFFVFHSRFAAFGRRIRRNIAYLFFEDTVSPGEQHITAAAETGLTRYQLIFRFIQRFGAIWIYGIVGILCLIFIMRKILKEKNISYLEFLYSIQFIIGIIIGLFMLTTRVLELETVRFSRYAILMVTLLVGIYFNKDIVQLKRKSDDHKYLVSQIKISFIVILILLSLVVSMLTVYSTNQHLTYSEIEGTNWHLKHSNLEREVIKGPTPGYRMITFLHGAEPEIERSDGDKRRIERGDVFPSSEETPNYPPHLGYGENDTVAETFDEDVYIMVSPYDYNWYKALFSNQLETDFFVYYTQEDLENLENDSTGNKLYSNGDFYIWEVNV